MKKNFCAVISFMVLIFASGCRPTIPEFMPTYESERCSVWIAENPKAFITRAYKIFGGQMEIDGDMCLIHAVTIYDHSLNFRKFDDVYSFDENTGEYRRNSENTVSNLFEFDTIYKENSIVCKVHWLSKYFAGQEIIFTKYAKDEVTPAEFGFDLEEWDYFVPVEMREERVSSSPEETPVPTPVLEPTPTPTAQLGRGPMYLSMADAIPGRQVFSPCCSKYKAGRSTRYLQQTLH